MAELDAKGRCCGRKPIFYKGGSYRSPPGAPLHFCVECCREFGTDGKQKANWAWKEIAPGVFEPMGNRPESQVPAKAERQ